MEKGDRNPGIDIAVTKHALKLWRQVTFFCVNEGPYFVALDAVAFKVTEYFILIDSTCVSDVFEKPYNCIFGNASHSHHRPDRHYFDQC